MGAVASASWLRSWAQDGQGERAGATATSRLQSSLVRRAEPPPAAGGPFCGGQSPKSPLLPSISASLQPLGPTQPRIPISVIAPWPWGQWVPFLMLLLARSLPLSVLLSLRPLLQTDVVSGAGISQLWDLCGAASLCPWPCPGPPSSHLYNGLRTRGAGLARVSESTEVLEHAAGAPSGSRQTVMGICGRKHWTPGASPPTCHLTAAFRRSITAGEAGKAPHSLLFLLSSLPGG